MKGLYLQLDPPGWSFLNGLLNHVVKEFNVEEVLKSPIFVVQKAAAPKKGVLMVPSEVVSLRRMTSRYVV